MNPNKTEGSKYKSEMMKYNITTNGKNQQIQKIIL